MLRTQFAAIAAIAALCAVELGAQEAITMAKAVELAAANNLSLQRSKLNADAKKRAADRAWNSLLPTAKATGTLYRSNEATVGDPEWTPSVGLGLSLTLSPSIVSGIDEAKADYESGLITYEQANRSLELTIRKSFNQVLLYKANVDIAARKIETAKSQYDQTAAKAKFGQASQLDALSAQVNWEAKKPTLASAEAAYQNALDAFKLLLGLPVEQAIVLDGSLGTSPAETSLGTAVRTDESADVVALRKSLELAQLGKKVVQDTYRMPSLSLSYSKTPTYANDEWSDKGSFSATIGIQLDSFLPWSATQEKLDQYDDSIASLSNQIAEAKKESEGTLRQLRRSIEQSIGSIEALVLNVTLAEKSYAMYEEAYKKGASDLQNLRDAGDTLEEARLSVVKEQYTLTNAILDLEYELNVPFGSIGTR